MEQRCRCSPRCRCSHHTHVGQRAFTGFSPTSDGVATVALMVLVTSSCFHSVCGAVSNVQNSTNLSASIIGQVSEYCEGQTFSPRCLNSDEVVVMISAHYGRMRLGRCLAVNYGNLGCQLDVLTQFDSWCSGQRQCDVRVSSIIDSLPDSGNAFPCIRDFRGYLEASYRCVKVVSSSKDDCTRSSSVQVIAERNSERHLASVVTEETGCGSLDTPWLLRAPPGHRIRLHLIDFETATRSASSRSHAGGPHVCQVYAVIKEKTSVRAGGGETVCGSDSRYSHVYSSLSNQVEIRIVAARKNHKSEHFLIKYEVTGCPDLLSSTGDVTAPHWMNRDGDSAIFGCNGTSETWQLRCEGDQWIGNRKNCSLLVPAAEKHDYNSAVWSVFTGSQWAAILIILAMAIFVGMVIFFVGLVYIRRRRLRESLRSRTYIDAGGSLCGDYHIGMHCPGDQLHHHHLHHHPSHPTGLLLPSKNSISTSNTVCAPLGSGGLISPSSCSGPESSGDGLPPASGAATLGGMSCLPGCTGGQMSVSSAPTENDYFRTWQLQRHAATRSNRSATASGRVQSPAVGDLFFDGCITGGGRHQQPLQHGIGSRSSPPEHIYESPKFDRRDFLPSLPNHQLQQQAQQTEAGLHQHQCICCTASMPPAPTFVGSSRGNSQPGGLIQYYDLDTDESTARM